MRIIADDLSGAADAGVAFVGNGEPVRLILDAADAAWADAAAGVVAVDTDTRAAAGDAAAAAVARLAATAPAGVPLLKKVDSALRGHPAHELRALREALPDRLVVFAPAFPRAGRTTVRGVQHVGGTPLHRTRAWAAEASPPPRSLAEALDGLPVLEVPAGPTRVAAGLRSAAAAGAIAVCDAATDEDLDAVVAAAEETAAAVAWAGSAGLAAALARARSHGGTASTWRADGDRYVAVLGSAARIASEQARALAAAGTDVMELPRRVLASGDDRALDDLAEELAARARRASLALTIAGRFEQASAAAVSASLARVAARAAAEAPVLALTGGATARAVLERLGVSSLELVAEPEPGIAVARAGAQHVLTKAGGFGDARTLVRTLHGSGA